MAFIIYSLKDIKYNKFYFVSFNVKYNFFNIIPISFFIIGFNFFFFFTYNTYTYIYIFKYLYIAK